MVRQSMYHSGARQSGRAFCKLMLLFAVPPVLMITAFRGGKSSGTVVHFVDVTSEAKINFKHENGASKDKLMVETFGSGVAWIDYDNDGYSDLFFANGANLSEGKSSPGNVLLRNTGKGTFVDVTKEAGLTGNGGFATGVAVGDFDNDGFLDIYVTGFGRNTLYHNNGNGTFTDVTAKAGVEGGGWSSSAGWFDYDRDGLLDLLVVRYLDYDPKKNPYCGLRKEGYRMYCDPRNFDGMTNLLYHNNGDGTFTEVSKAAGVANPAGKGLGVAFGDFNNDGWPDIFVSNDTVRNFLYLNNDGQTDIYVTNGHVTDNVELYHPRLSYMQTDLLYKNENGHFRDVSSESGPALQIKHVGRGMAIGDFDNDGDLDIVISNCGQRPILMRNDGGNKNHWIAIKARGKESNSFGVGARVRVTTATRTQIKEIGNAGSYLSSSDLRLYFGLGNERIVKNLEIIWPSGKKQILTDLKGDRMLFL